jgi:hypothetical protein
MPTIKLPDGTNLFVQSSNPEDVEIAKKRFQKRKTSGGSSDSLAGDIGRGIGAGIVSIPQGLITIPTTGIDLLFNTEVTDNVNDFFEGIKPEVDSTAGKTAQMIAQFGIPGLGTAGALSKLSKFKQLAAIGAVDAAVATDDVDTFVDMIFDKESDEERIKNLEGREAAAARLKERMQVFAETASVVYAVPKVVGGTIKTAGVGLDLAAPYISTIAKKINPNEALASATKADKKLFDYLRKNFTEGGIFEQTAKNNKAISDVYQTQKAYASNQALEIADNMDKITRTLTTAVKGRGLLNQKDALELVKAISTYRAPLLAVERQYPNLKSGAKKQQIMKRFQDDALKKIKSFEGQGNKIDYDALNISSENYISNILKNNRGLFAQEQKLLSDLIADKTTIAGLTLDDAFKKALIENRGMYGTTLYRKLIDSNFEPSKEVYDRAINKIKEILDIAPTDKLGTSKAKQIFDKLSDPEFSKNSYETPEFFLNNITGGALKGKKLKNLPEIREALGEITPLTYKKGSDWKKALQDENFAATATMSKIASLSADVKVFDDIYSLNESAKARGTTPFLKTIKDLENKNINVRDTDNKLLETLEIDGVLYRKFDSNQGALKDTYAPEVFYNAVTGATSSFLKDSDNLLMQTYKGLLALKTVGQYNKTLLSIGAHIRNNTSVLALSSMNANLGPSGRFVDAFRKMFAGVFDPRQKTKYQKEIKEGKDYGVVVGRGTQLQEITELGEYATNDLSLLKQIKSKGYFQTLRNLFKPVERAYTGSDNAARMINWNGEQFKYANAILDSSDNSLIPISSTKSFLDPDIAKLIKNGGADGPVIQTKELRKTIDDLNKKRVKPGEMKKGDELLDKIVKSESADIALNVTPTYSRIPEIVKRLKFLPFLGNFTAFPAEIVRNTGNTLRRSIKELASSNVEFQKIGMRRLAGALTTTIGLPVGLTKAGMALTGAEQEQLDAYKRSFAAPWERNATLIPTSTDEQGNITGFINYSYTNPYDYLQRPVQALFNAYADGERNEANLVKTTFNASIDMIGEMTEPFLSTSIGANAVLEAKSGKTSTGKIIYNESDLLGDQIEKSMIHVFNSIAPTSLPFTIQTDAEGTQIAPKDFITAAAAVFTGERDLISPKGKEIDVAETMVQAFSGIKVIKPQLERSLYYKAAESKRAIRETTNEFNRLLRSNNRRDAESFLKGYINTNEDRYNSLRTLYTAIEDARTLGLADYQISEQLKIAKVANRDLVMLGIFKPSEINPDVLKFAIQGSDIKAAQPIPIGDLARTQIDLLGQSLQGQFESPELTPPGRYNNRASQVLREEELDKLTGGT